MLHFAQSVVEHALGSAGHGSAKVSKQDRGKEFFNLLPDDLLSSVVGLLDVKALLCLQQCDRRLQRLAGSEKLWQGVFMGRFGLPSKNQETAHKLAGSWQALYKSKIVTEQSAGQWRKPCPFELQAALTTMINTTATTSATTTVTGSEGAAAENAAAVGIVSEGGGSPARQSSSSSSSSSSVTDSEEVGVSQGSLFSSTSLDSGVMNNEGVVEGGGEGKTELAVIFLLDSSGSVGDEDFTCMTDFLETAAQAVTGLDNCKVCVVQFSNDTRVEFPLGPLDKPAFDTAVKGMVRLNGGTNIASAVAKAGSLLKADEAAHSSNMRRVLVLLTDGRIDSYQAREAASMVSRLSDEQANVALWAFGVGRGVDSAELMRIIEGPGEACKGLGQERYMDLCVRDDAPW